MSTVHKEFCSSQLNVIAAKFRSLGLFNKLDCKTEIMCLHKFAKFQPEAIGIFMTVWIAFNLQLKLIVKCTHFTLQFNKCYVSTPM